MVSRLKKQIVSQRRKGAKKTKKDSSLRLCETRFFALRAMVSRLHGFLREGYIMSEKSEALCAHPACNCMVPEGEKYCSAYCEDAGHTTEISCNCGHAGCSLAEGVLHGAA